jgi:phage terminase large subunit GpA-like protein
MVNEFLGAKGNPEALKTFINEQLTELWTEPGEVLEWRTLLDRREPYPVGTVPQGGLFLTSSVDVQREDGGRLEVRVTAYGENRERWAVDYRIFPGDPTDQKTWEPVEAMLREGWPTESGGELAIERMFVDSGDGAVTASVYEWVKKQPRPRVWAIKGDKRSDTPVGKPREVETTTGGRKLKFGVVFKIVNSDFFKAQFYADLKKRPPTEEERLLGMAYPQGYFHAPVDAIFGDEHFKQICSEQLVTRRNKNGRSVTEWEQTRPRNEALDTQVYCDAGAWDFGSNRFQPRHWEILRQRNKELAPPAPSAPAVPQPAAPDPAAPQGTATAHRNRPRVQIRLI